MPSASLLEASRFSARLWLWCLRGSSCCPVKRQVCCPSALLDAQNWGHSYSLWAVVPHKGSLQRPEGTSEFGWGGAELTVGERDGEVWGGCCLALLSPVSVPWW